MKIQTSALLVLIKKLAGNMNASVANQKTRIKLHMKIFERIKKSNEKHLVNLCKSNNFEIQTSLS